MGAAEGTRLRRGPAALSVEGRARGTSRFLVSVLGHGQLLRLHVLSGSENSTETSKQFTLRASSSPFQLGAHLHFVARGKQYSKRKFQALLRPQVPPNGDPNSERHDTSISKHPPRAPPSPGWGRGRQLCQRHDPRARSDSAPSRAAARACEQPGNGRRRGRAPASASLPAARTPCCPPAPREPKCLWHRAIPLPAQLAGDQGCELFYRSTGPPLSKSRGLLGHCSSAGRRKAQERVSLT